MAGCLWAGVQMCHDVVTGEIHAPHQSSTILYMLNAGLQQSCAGVHTHVAHGLEVVNTCCLLIHVLSTLAQLETA
jgi:hypothetical protein